MLLSYPFFTHHLINELLRQLDDYILGNSKTRVGAMRIDGLQEMRHLFLIDLLHVNIVSIARGARESDIGHTVAELHERSIRSFTDTFIITFISPFLTSAPLLIGQGIDNLGSQQCLTIIHKRLRPFHHIVIAQAGILNTVMIVSTKHHWHHIGLIDTHKVAELNGLACHHIQMVAVGQILTISLIHALMKVVSRLADALNNILIAFKCCLEIFLVHDIGVVWMYKDRTFSHTARNL